MRRLLLCVALQAALWPAAAAADAFGFGVIAHVFEHGDDSALKAAIAETDADNLAFVVANGIKARTESCSDKLFSRRKALLDDAKNGLVLSLAASDWTECKTGSGKPAAIERLNRLRELFFTEDFSLGASKLPLIRQSNMPKFREYGENARWEIGDILFATINLPAGNNHYLHAAGRNSEFEDRSIANRDWLQRIFAIAERKKLSGIVLFSDGNPLRAPASGGLFDLGGKRDGFAETRKRLLALASKFPGKVLLVHAGREPAPAAANGIVWNGNLGTLATGKGWFRLNVEPASPALFTLQRQPSAARALPARPIAGSRSDPAS